jgi:hypothetical protein
MKADEILFGLNIPNTKKAKASLIATLAAYNKHFKPTGEPNTYELKKKED